MNEKVLNLSRYRANEENAQRLLTIEEHEYRSPFQRDRDRILYSKEFRRLSGKTQVFVTGSDDNMRTRLTHTLEVAQIAETISDRLQLNSMLTRAIALGHDIGHTPFGHVGERTLNYIMNGCFDYYEYSRKLREEDKGFKHNLQGIRVACKLENDLDKAEKGQFGLNLTRYTLWGIKNHSSLYYKHGCEYCLDHKQCRYKNSGKPCKGYFSVDYYNNLPYKSIDRTDWTLEGVIVAYADEIAQRHHDIEDGIYAGIIDFNSLCEYLKDTYAYHEAMQKKLCEVKDTLSKLAIDSQGKAIQLLSKVMVDTYVTDYSDSLAIKMEELAKEMDLRENNKWREDVFAYVAREQKDIIKFFNFSKELKEADDDFQKYLSNHILLSNLAQCMDGKASYIIRQLVKAYLTNPQQLPDRTIHLIVRDWNEVNSVEEKETLKHMTEASKARERLKQLIKKDDSDISNILLRRICDHIAGMTDQYAMFCFEQLYGSKGYETIYR